MVRFQLPDGRTVMVNPHQVTYVEEHDPNACTVYLATGKSIFLEEPAVNVAAKLRV